MFRGDAQHSIDSKGRLIVPVKFREQLGEHFVITKGLDNCLFVFPLCEYEQFEQKIKNLPISDPSVRKFTRALVGSAFDAETDAQGRTLIPPSLRAHAGITKEVVMVGMISRIEIWSLETWQKYSEADNFFDDEIAAKMAEFGI